jgi:hypothetical protein
MRRRDLDLQPRNKGRMTCICSDWTQERRVRRWRDGITKFMNGASTFSKNLIEERGRFSAAAWLVRAQLRSPCAPPTPNDVVATKRFKITHDADVGSPLVRFLSGAKLMSRRSVSAAPLMAATPVPDRVTRRSVVQFKRGGAFAG